MAHSLRSLSGFCMGEYRKFVLEKNIILTTLILTSFMLWVQGLCREDYIMMIASRSVFYNNVKFCFCLGKNKIDFLEKKV